MTWQPWRRRPPPVERIAETRESLTDLAAVVDQLQHYVDDLREVTAELREVTAERTRGNHDQ